MQKKSTIYLLIFDDSEQHYFVESVEDRRQRPAKETLNLSIRDQGRYSDMNRKAKQLNKKHMANIY